MSINAAFSYLSISIFTTQNLLKNSVIKLEASWIIQLYDNQNYRAYFFDSFYTAFLNFL